MNHLGDHLESHKGSCSISNIQSDFTTTRPERRQKIRSYINPRTHQPKIMYDLQL